MSIIFETKLIAKLQAARSQPNLPFVPFCISTTLTSVRSEHFSDIQHRVDVCFVSQGPLACILYDEQSAVIYIHQMLNHWQTPPAVITHVLKHELLHLRIAPANVKNRLQHHPPEFWQQEAEISPERISAWQWIWINLGKHLKKRPRLELLDIVGKWQKTWAQPKLSIEQCTKLISPGALQTTEFC
jgi:hypothetical protein